MREISWIFFSQWIRGIWIII